MENWVTPQNYPGYAVSTEGRVRNLERDRDVKTRVNQAGVLMVSLHTDKGQVTRAVSHLVASLYLDPPPYESFNSVVHLNGDKKDCRVDNLVWRPKWFAVRYNRMFDDPPHSFPVFIEETSETFETLRDLCVFYGLIEQDEYDRVLSGAPTFYYGFHIRPLV